MHRILTLLIFLCASPGFAQGFWEYGSWRVVIDEVDTGEDLRRTCYALTGGDGQPTVAFSFSNGDAGPPWFFPSVIVYESAPRGFDTVLQDGQSAYIRFDDEQVMDGTVYAYLDEDGFARAEISFDHPLSQWVLQSMRVNGQMDVVVAGDVFMYAYLDGFTASYLKAAEECGFDGSGVVN